MARYKLLIEYEGTRYSGWQAQKGMKTVQGAFFSALDKLFPGQNAAFYGAGRTDSGVHALGQVAHLDAETNLPPLTLRYRLNDLLPADINVLDVNKSARNFHARHDAVYRSYVYIISKRRTAFGKNHCWWIKDSLDQEAMNSLAGIFTGMHDFRSFTDQTPEEGSTLVEVKFVDIHDSEEMIAIHITGSHFLWKMVRRMVGIMVEAGRGNISEKRAESYLGAYSPEVAEFTAPPAGLYLHRVYYPGEKVLRGTEVVPRLVNFSTGL
jgi:tRNA pseudouridine38-40 synthase